MALHLEAITFGTLLKMGLPNHVIFNQPPGTMKSLEVSVFWHAWEWGPCNMPGTRWLTTSYNDKYVTRDCRKARDLMLSEWYQKRWPHVRMTRYGETSFENDQKGTREGVPFGSLTGGRGDRLVIDDPHSTETAESDSERETAARILRESVPSRVNDLRESAIAIMMQRLHGQDVTGVALGLEQGYIHVRMPMRFESEPDDDSPEISGPCVTPLWSDPRTEEGELLFPEKFAEPEVTRLEKSLGSYGTAGQLQQRPTPRGGGLFKREWFEVVDALPARLFNIVRAWDLAGTTKKKSPWTCGLRMGQDENGTYYITNVVRGQLTPQKAEEMIVNTASQDGHTTLIDIPQDPGQAGKSQVRYLVKALVGYTIRWSPETGSKEDRARPASSQAEAGNIKLLRGAWNQEFLDEVSSFPKGQFKDQVDAMSRAFTRIVQLASVNVPPQGPRSR